MIRRIAIVGASTRLGRELTNTLSQHYKVHAVRQWSESAVSAGIDKVADWSNFEQLVDAMNGCTYAVFCAASDDYSSLDLVQTVRVFLAACRETKPARSLVFLSATSMMDGEIGPSHFYLPGTSSAVEDAVYSAEMDVQRYHADAMDVGIVLHAPVGAVGEGVDAVTSPSEAAKTVLELLDVRVLPVRQALAISRGTADSKSEALRFEQAGKNCGVDDTLSL